MFYLFQNFKSVWFLMIIQYKWKKDKRKCLFFSSFFLFSPPLSPSFHLSDYLVVKGRRKWLIVSISSDLNKAQQESSDLFNRSIPSWFKRPRARRGVRCHPSSISSASVSIEKVCRCLPWTTTRSWLKMPQGLCFLRIEFCFCQVHYCSVN